MDRLEVSPRELSILNVFRAKPNPNDKSVKKMLSSLHGIVFDIASILLGYDVETSDKARYIALKLMK